MSYRKQMQDLAQAIHEARQNAGVRDDLFDQVQGLVAAIHDERTDGEPQIYTPRQYAATLEHLENEIGDCAIYEMLNNAAAIASGLREAIENGQAQTGRGINVQRIRTALSALAAWAIDRAIEMRQLETAIYDKTADEWTIHSAG